jgi:phospholipid/cholesterol/gamma-HCH transport system substrate-binding protein
MPRTRSLGWSELKIGLMTLAAIAIAAAVIFLLSGSGGFFWQRYALRAKFTNVAGLKTGAPVRVSGVEVGSVKDIADSTASRSKCGSSCRRRCSASSLTSRRR